MTNADALTEAQWQRQLVDLAAMLGYHWLHLRPGRTTHGWAVPVQGTLGEGWPDLVFVRERDRRILFVELKAGKGKLTEEQEYVLGILRAAGCETYVWWPTDIDAAYAVLDGRDSRSPDELLPARPASGVSDLPGGGTPASSGPPHASGAGAGAGRSK